VSASVPATEPSTWLDNVWAHVTDRATAPALTFLSEGERESAQLSYGQLGARVRAIASRLAADGLYGKTVLLLYLQGLEFVEAILACLVAGAVPVPAYAPHPSQLQRVLARLHTIVREVRPDVALTTNATLESISGRLDGFPHLKESRWLATDELASGDGTLLRPRAQPDDVAFIQYTSGSISEPKGVILTHGNLTHQCVSMRERLGWSEQLVMVSWLPLFHDMGLIGAIFQTVYNGGHAIVMSPLSFLQKPIRWLAALSRYRGTCSPAPNFGYDRCARRITPVEAQSLDLTAWQHAMCGSETVRPDTIERFTRVFASSGFRPEAFYPCYGLAENTLMATGGTQGVVPHVISPPTAAITAPGSDDQAPRRTAASLVGCGRTLPDQDLAIVDPIKRTEVPLGSEGEVWLSGPSVARGYWMQPEATAETFHAFIVGTRHGDADRLGPFLRTGDLGVLLDGELCITGRLKDVIVVRGQNRHPVDIEWTVQGSHAAVRASGCAAFADEGGGREGVVVAVEVDLTGTDCGESLVPEVITSIRRSISAQHGLQPLAIALLRPGTLPKTTSGKVQRGLCRSLYRAQKLDVLSMWSAEEAIE
jgi:acyl-CoA synthetase (AMP-forming)/AMP-acid ligase II